MGAVNEIFVGLWSATQRHAQEGRKVAKQQSAKTYTKPESLAMFERVYNAHKYDKLQSVPESARVWARFHDDSANELTKAIIAHLRFTGNFAARVNTTGIYDSRSGLYRQANARKGMADISAIIEGKAVQIEVKAGRDAPRDAQKRVQAEYRAAGGMYEFVRNFDEYAQLYESITNKKVWQYERK